MTESPRRLPSELLSLVHHVELHKSGWWDDALQQLILYVLWLNNDFMSVETIHAALIDSFTINVDLTRLDAQMNALEDNDKIVRTATATYKMTEQQRKSVHFDVQTANNVEKRIEEQFIDKVSSACPDIDPHECWNEFNQRCLIPLVMDMGARTYRFLSEGTRPKELSFEDTEFFARYGPEAERLRQIVVDFITPDDPIVRDYILRTLDAAFFLEASGLRKETLEKLSSNGRQRSLTLFLDTNLLFSVLNLHNNPSNQSVRALLQLITDIDQTITCELYALPITVDEFRRTLSANCKDLKHISFAKSMAAAALVSDKLSGIKMRYVEACQDSGHIDPEDFFQPYVSNPIAVMRSKGVELFNDKLEKYRIRQDVVDDINELWEAEDRKSKNDSRYRAVEHDMMLLHFVEDRRPAFVSSPYDAKYWVVTIDYGLLRYDRSRSEDLAICIHPSMLVQMLQFWLPRTEALESAMVESLRIPFVFRRFDVASEKAALRILEVLSRFEIGDLSTEVITQLLLDDAVNTAIVSANDEEEEAAIVKERLSIVDKDIEQKLELAMKESSDLKLIAEQRSSRIGELQRDITQGKATVQDLEQALEHSDRSLSDREKDINELRAKLSTSEAESSSTKQVLEYFLKWVLLPLIATFMIATATGLVVSATKLVPPTTTMAVISVVCLGTVLGIADWRGANIDSVRRMRWHTRLRRWHRWVYGALSTITLSLVSRFIWEIIWA